MEKVQNPVILRKYGLRHVSWTMKTFVCMRTTFFLSGKLERKAQFWNPSCRCKVNIIAEVLKKNLKTHVMV
jgi:hypothetical protein